MATRYTAFEDGAILARGIRQTIVRKINARVREGNEGSILIF